MFRGSYTAGSVAFLLLSTTLPAFCLRIFPQNASRLMVGGTALAPGLLHTKPPRLPSRKPGRFVCFRGAFSGAHAKPCEGSFGKPRGCREKVSGGNRHQEGLGSPPRMRGKGHLTLAVSHMHRINPAYAGKSTLPHHRAHFAMGSPPRMRGKAEPFKSLLVTVRITPAYAGKSSDGI
mgnify:FL=1